MNEVSELQQLEAQLKVHNQHIREQQRQYETRTRRLQQAKDQTHKTLKSKLLSHYYEFRVFCKEHWHLFEGMYQVRRDTDRVIDIKLKPSKQAVLVVLENTFDACYQKSCILVPYDFIEDRDEFLQRRIREVTATKLQYKRQALQQKREQTNNQIDELERDVMELQKQYDELVESDN